MTDAPDFQHQDLAGAGLLLRMPREGDAGPITLYAGDARVACMTTAIPHPYPPGAAQDFIASARSGRRPEHVWAIDATPGDGPEFVGVISYAAAIGEIGYWIGPPFWGTGHATEALTLLTNHLLTEGGREYLQAHVFFDNPASQQVLKKVGFGRTDDAWLFSVARGVEVPGIRFRLDAATRAMNESARVTP